METWTYDDKRRKLLDENGLPVAHDVNADDAATILRAVNPLAVDPLSIARDAMELGARYLAEALNRISFDATAPEDREGFADALAQLRAALKTLEGA